MTTIKEDLDYEEENAFLQKVDRIITGDIKITVEEMKQGQHIAMANSKTKEIYLNYNKIAVTAKNAIAEQQLTQQDPRSIKQEFVALFKGFNYHELAHIIYTKYQAKQIKLDLIDRVVLNCLEDGRIETLFSNYYYKTKKYFINCFTKFIYESRDKADPIMTYISTRSRKIILPKKIVNYFAKIFKKVKGKKLYEEINILIDEYITCTDTNRQIEIAKIISEKLYPEREADQTTIGIFLQGEQSLKGNGKKYPKKIIIQIQDLKELMKQMKEAKEEPTNQKTKQEIENNAQIIIKIQLTNKQIKDLQQEANKLAKENDQIIHQTFEDKTLNPSPKTINDAKKKMTKNDKIIADINQKVRQEKRNIKQEFESMNFDELTQETDKIEESQNKTIEKEVEQDMKTIYQDQTSGKSAGIGQDIEEVTQKINITSKDKTVSKKLNEVIRIIRNDLTNGYQDKKSIGKINIRRAMNMKKTGQTKIFKKYRPDKLKNTKIGTIILLDASPSMSHKEFENAMKSSWAISESLNKTGSKTMVISYSDKHKIIKDFETKMQLKRYEGGGTMIVSSIKEAQKQMKKYKRYSKIKNWLLLIMTDGEWHDAKQADKLIKELNRKKVETAIINFQEENNRWKNDNFKLDNHNCKHQATIKNITNLGKEFKKIVIKIEQNIKEQIKREM